MSGMVLLKREREKGTNEKTRTTRALFFFFTFLFLVSLVSFFSLSLSLFPSTSHRYNPHLRFAGTASSIIFGFGRFSAAMIFTNSASLLPSPSLGFSLFSSPIVELVIPL